MAAKLPDHDDIADIFLRLGALYPPSELHGFLLGQLVIGQRIEEKTLREQVAQLLDCDAFPDDDWAVLMQVYQAASEQLGADIHATSLLLPGDEVDLGQRVASVGSWCQGFLTGFAMAGKVREQQEGKQQYSAAVSEILNDMASISQAGLDDEAGAEAEDQFRELVSYLEMATVSLFVECCSQSALTGAHPAPKQLH